MDRTLIWQLAIRYLRGKRSANAVPILSRISMVAIAVSSAAMIIIFSVMNGLGSIAKGMYKAFYPEIRISTARGKFFKIDTAQLNAIKQVSGVQNITAVIEDNVFANNNEQQKVITLKGVDNNYFKVNDIRQYITDGDDTVSAGTPNTAIAGVHILNELGADVNNVFSYLELYYPNPEVTNPGADPLSAFQSLKLHPSGAFRVGDEFDTRYVLAPISLTQQLFRQEGRVSSIEIKALPAEAKRIQKDLRQLLRGAYKVETRYEQNRTLYMMMGVEKWGVFFILLLVMLIASFNMVGALSMLVLEKQKDIAILKAMGARQETIRKIFLLEGVLWSLTGGIFGIILGGGLCLLQQNFGIIRMGGSFIVDAFPVEMQLEDIGLVIITIIAVGVLVAWYPAIRATKAADPSLKSS